MIFPNVSRLDEDEISKKISRLHLFPYLSKKVRNRYRYVKKKKRK